jgi:hypothetical protein
MMIRCFFFTLFLLTPGWKPLPIEDQEGIYFDFKSAPFVLTYRAQKGRTMGAYSDCNNGCLDTLCNQYLVAKQYVEIIRQDDPRAPHLGIALGFEFDETNGTYPYTPANAVIQLKNFSWGGIEFSQTDTLNYTGVSNNISDDVTLEVDGFVNDTIFGHFSGVLLSGAGPMASLEHGRFRAFLYRK